MQEEFYFLRLCRYVEANALRANLVKRAEDWPWSGLYARRHSGKELMLARWPIHRPQNWLGAVNGPLPERDLDQLRTSVNRGRPLGGQQWVQSTARRLGLDFTLRNPGRPRHNKDNE